MSETAGLVGLSAVDTHAHIYPLYDLDLALDAAVANLNRAAGSSEVGRLLLIADPVDADTLAQLDNKLASVSRWRIAAGSSCARGLRREDGANLIAVRGHQVATREGFEVLVFDDRATDDQIVDRLPLDETLRWARASHALVIVPWGFGKWWFERRKILLEIIGRGELAEAFLGDSGNRPVLGPRSAVLRRASKLGMRILPGSDPPPIAGDEARVGSSGVVVGTAFECEHPVADLVAHLQNGSSPVRPFRRGASAAEFFRNQLLVRTRRVVS